MNIRNVALKWISAVGVLLLAKMAQIFKVSFVLGSYTMFFSLSNSVTPLAGAFAGFGGVGFAGFLKLGMAFLYSGGMLSGAYLANIVPGIIAGLYWASDSFIIRLITPLLCVALFLAHPSGASAWWYSLYWFIPAGLYFARKQHLFFNALASTFVAHGVGSVIWLYTVPMTTGQWAALMPVVIIERVLFALGMVALYRVAQWALNSRLLIRFRFA